MESIKNCNFSVIVAQLILNKNSVKYKGLLSFLNAGTKNVNFKVYFLLSHKTQPWLVGKFTM